MEKPTGRGSVLRVMVALVPVLVAAAVTFSIQIWVLAPALKGRGALLYVAAYVGLAVATILIARVVERGARRALPLAALLRLSMLFPDQAPSRFQMARTARQPRRLEQAR